MIDLPLRIEFSDTMITVMPLALVVLLFVLVRVWRKKRSVPYLLYCAVFGVYLLAVLDITLFPIRVLDQPDYYSWERFMRGTNFIPFNFDMSFIPHIVIRQIVQNILLTIPFGFGVSFVAQVRPRTILWLAPAVGIGLEGMQLIISLLLRYPYRIVDIDDAILNALGVLIGYGLFLIARYVYTLLMERKERWIHSS